jgi:hypothetical protein
MTAELASGDHCRHQIVKFDVRVLRTVHELGTQVFVAIVAIASE